MDCKDLLNRRYSITVSEAARRLSYWAMRARDENITIVLTRHGVPVAKIMPPEKEIMLAEVLERVRLDR
jgi:antitoxin (DNA-binding transcriptional repressor) of toxin-antitoxin stability system